MYMTTLFKLLLLLELNSIRDHLNTKQISNTIKFIKSYSVFISSIRLFFYLFIAIVRLFVDLKNSDKPQKIKSF